MNRVELITSHFASKGNPPMTIRTISKQLDIKLNEVFRVLQLSSKFEKVNPLECGSGKESLSAYRMIDN
jgi:hypothetical protein